MHPLAKQQLKIQQQMLRDAQDAAAKAKAGFIVEAREITPIFLIAMQQQQQVGAVLDISDDDRRAVCARQIRIQNMVSEGVSLSDAMAGVDGTPRVGSNVVSIADYPRKPVAQQKEQAGETPQAQLP